MKIIFFTLFILLIPFTFILPQLNDLHPDAVNYPVYMDQGPQLSSVKSALPSQNIEDWENNEIPIHTRPTLNKNIIKNENFRDPVVQDKFGSLKTSGTIANFDGFNNTNNAICSCLPPDVNIAVGLNRIMQTANAAVEIFDKTGAVIMTPKSLAAYWVDIPGPWAGRADGDPIVLYDQFADRWMISQFCSPNTAGPFYELIAVSTTGDPAGSYTRYIYSFTYLPDYPKIAVWRDGYYLSVNYFNLVNGTWQGTGSCVMERDSMLAGKTARIVMFSTTASDTAFGFLPSTADGKVLPPAGSPNYFICEIDSASWGSTGPDRLSFRALHVDWNNTSNSTFSAPISMQVASFDENLCNFNSNCIPQSGTSTKVASLSDRLMYRSQYRNFGSYQTIVCNHTVDVGGDHAGIRWYEFRNTGSGWSIYQQGTYAPDSTHRWMGSIAMDGSGNIAVGFSNSSSTMNPAIKYTGRYGGDSPGTFSLAEQSIINGTGSEIGTYYRWGDYSSMVVDPVDDATFWYANEYYKSNSVSYWVTRIASFVMPSSIVLNSPVGGEFWTNGSVHNITWNAVGVSNVKLEYTTNNGTNWVTIIASTPGNTGSYVWNLPSLSYDLVKVRVTNLSNTSVTAQSGSYFSVANNTSNLSPAVGSNSSTSFAGTGITFTGNVTVSAPVTVNYYSANIAAGTLPAGVKVVSPYFWVVTNSGIPPTTFTNGKMIAPLSFLSGANNSSALLWLKRTNKGDPWTSIGGTINGSNLESNAAFSSFSEFAIGSSDSTNFASIATLTALIQGFFNGSTMISDTVTLELHNTFTPFLLVESKKGVLNTAGVGTFYFSNTVNSVPYYIVVKHRNSVETWSAIAQSFTSSTLSYNFTTASSRAYGSNMVLKNGKYCIYSGDVNQDGIIDSGDLGVVDNDNANYVSGYVNTDVNGDGIVDSGDLGLVDNNNAAYVSKIVPSGPPVATRFMRRVKIQNNNIK